MKKIFLFLSLFLLAKANAQVNLPLVFEVKTDTELKETLPNRYWQMLEDKNGNLTFDQVRRPPLADQFYYNPTGKINRKVATKEGEGSEFVINLPFNNL